MTDKRRMRSYWIWRVKCPLCGERYYQPRRTDHHHPKRLSCRRCYSLLNYGRSTGEWWSVGKARGRTAIEALANFSL